MKLRRLLLSWFAAACATSAAAGVVEDWNETVIAAIKASTPPPALASRNLAIIHLAMHRAALDAKEPEAAVAVAAHETATALFPAYRAAFDAALANTKPSVAAESARAAARAVLAARADDGSSTTVPYIPKDGPGQWRRTSNARPPETPQWPDVRPFLLDRGDQFRPPAPQLDSAVYAESVRRVHELGGVDSTVRTAEQTMLAKFWSDFSYTATPPGHWNAVAREIARARKLSVRKSARLFAVLNVAMADAAVAIFDVKYATNFWRPETAIVRAAEDGNEATAADPAWKPLLPSPPHPEFVSGHSGFSAAAAVVLTELLPENGASFQARSDTVKDVVRTYKSYAKCAEEIGQSRVWGGLHFPLSCDAGLELGRKVGRWTLDHAKALDEP